MLLVNEYTHVSFYNGLFCYLQNSVFSFSESVQVNRSYKQYHCLAWITCPCHYITLHYSYVQSTLGTRLYHCLACITCRCHYVTLLLCAEYAGYQTIPLSSLYYLPLPLHYITLMCRVHWVPDYTIVYDIAIYLTDHICISVIVII